MSVGCGANDHVSESGRGPVPPQNLVIASVCYVVVYVMGSSLLFIRQSMWAFFSQSAGMIRTCRVCSIATFLRKLSVLCRSGRCEHLAFLPRVCVQIDEFCSGCRNAANNFSAVVACLNMISLFLGSCQWDAGMLLRGALQILLMTTELCYCVQSFLRNFQEARGNGGSLNQSTWTKFFYLRWGNLMRCLR